MKIQNIYHLLQAALLLLLVVSCTQEEFPAAQDKALQLTISVTDGGYTSTEGKTTRAVENGYTTEFTEGDACGLYMVRGGKPVYSNVKLTAEKDAATGGIMWKTDGTTLAAGMDGESYYLYYPYQADMAGKTATHAEGAVMTDAEFFKPLIDGWQPGDDQSTHAAYTASDLMTAGGSTTGTGNTIHLSFAMKHRMALAVIEMPKTVYKFIDANVPDYTVGAEATFTGTAKPLRMADGTYRYLVHSSMPTIEGCYDGGNREFTITTSASHPVVGEYKRYKVDGAAETIKNVTYAESGIARIGDFYCTKDNGTTGYLIPKEADETTVQAAKVVGIVFQTDKSRIGAKEKEKLGGEGNVHGLVMAVKNIATRQAWGLFGMDEGLTTCRTKADNYNDISGYGNCEHIRANRGSFANYPAFKAADGYNTTCPVPATTTGWYLPASGQWWDILQNLGGCPALADVTQQTSPDPDIAEGFLWKSQGDVPAALNKWMENIAVGDKDTFNNLVSFCSSSEHSKYHTWYWILNNFQGMVRCIWADKFDGSDNVRPVLAF
ncbi:fimbrillin family protein [Alistipes onderdonkii]|uniref:fimbrillin family protein n=1 Tax=Alistipes onderdonkii TaxID=328813 RepID=UPI0034A35EA6